MCIYIYIYICIQVPPLASPHSPGQGCGGGEILSRERVEILTSVYGVLRARILTYFCAVLARFRRLCKSPQYLVILHGK